MTYAELFKMMKRDEGKEDKGKGKNERKEKKNEKIYTEFYM